MKPLAGAGLSNKKTLSLLKAKGLKSRDDKIRTCDPLHPMQVRYRAALRPELM